MARAPQAPPVSSSLAPALLRHVRDRGEDAALLATRFGLAPDAIERDEVSVAPSVVHELLASAADVLGEPCLALSLPDALPFRRYRFAELTVRASATARDALARIAHYVPSLVPGLEASLETRDDALVFRVRTPGQPRGFGRHANEYALAYALGHVRRESGQPIAATRAWFAHARPRDLAPLHRFFATRELAFGADDSGLELRAADGAIALRASDPRLLATVEPLAEAELGAVPSLRRLEPSVAAKIAALLPGADVARVAKALHMSARTLQRRLEAEGTSYGESLDAVRATLARRWLRDEGRTVAEVGARLGFADAATFGRAFKRWTGRTPGALRAR